MTDPRSDAEARYDATRPTAFGTIWEQSQFVIAADALRASAPRQETPQTFATARAASPIVESTDGLGGKHYHRVVGTTETGIVIEAAPPPEER